MPTQPTVIKFFAPVVDATINALMQAVDQKMARGQQSFITLLSSPGGSVFHGLSAYNYLKGLPAEISTHNFGSVDSQLEERLKGLRIDIENIAKVVAANTGKSVQEVTQAMLDRTTLNPEEAQGWGLVHEIKTDLFPAGAEVISIQSQEQQR